MRFAVLFSLLVPFFATSVGAQEPVTPVGPAPIRPLISHPARDLFDLATLFFRDAESSSRDQESKRRDLRLANRYFARFLQQFPGHQKATEAAYFLALSHQKLGETDQAMANFQKVAATQPANPGPFYNGALIALASHAFDQKNYAAAIPPFQQILQTTQDPRVREEATYRLFLSHYRLNQTQPAITTLEQYLELPSPSPSLRHKAQLTLAQLYQKTGRLPDALDVFQNLAETAPPAQGNIALLSAARLARQLEQPDRARLLHQQILANPGLKKHHGQAQLILMDRAAAAKDWTEVLRLRQLGNFSLPPAARPQRDLLTARAYEATGRADEALTHYKRSGTDQGKKAGFDAAYRLLVKNYQSNPDRFPKPARKFLQQHKNSPQIRELTTIRFLLATQLFNQKQYQQVLKLHRQINLTQLDPANHRTALFQRAISSAEKAPPAEALAAINRYLSEHPETAQSPKLQLERATILARLDRETEAIPDYQSLAKHPDSRLQTHALQALASIYRKQDNTPAFLQTQRDLLALPNLTDAQRATAHFWLGREAFRQKQAPRAKSNLEKARKLAPKTFSPKVGPLLVRLAYQANDLDQLEREINTLQELKATADIPADITSWLAATLSQQGKHPRAWRLFSSTDPADLAPALQRAYLNSALALGKNQAALGTAARLLATETDPWRKAQLHFQTAQAHLAQGDFDPARQATSDALDLHPTGDLDFDLRLLAGQIEMAADQPRDALRHFLLTDTLYATDPVKKALARQHLRVCLQTINTPESQQQLKKFPAIE